MIPRKSQSFYTEHKAWQNPRFAGLCKAVKILWITLYLFRTLQTPSFQMLYANFLLNLKLPMIGGHTYRDYLRDFPSVFASVILPWV